MTSLSPAEVPNILRQTPKGKLVYDRKGNDFFVADFEDSLKATAIHPSCLQLKPAKKLVSDSSSSDNGVSPRLMKLDDETYNMGDLSSLCSFDAADNKSTSATDSTIEEQIREYEEKQRQSVQKVFEDKRNMFKNYNETLYRNASLTLHSVNLIRTRDEYLKTTKLAARMRARQIEMEEKFVKLKNAYKSRAKESADRLEEASQKDQQEAEEAQKKSMEIQQRITDFTASGRRLFVAYQEMANLIKSHENAKLLPDSIRQAVHSVNEIMSQFQKMVKQFHSRVLEQKDVELIQGLERNTIKFLEVIKESIASAKEQISINEPPPAVNAVETANTDLISRPINDAALKDVKTNLGNDIDVIREFDHYMMLKTNAQQLRDAIRSDQSLKNYRNDWHKAVNVTVNAISAQSGTHLLEKLMTLSQLLEGHVVTVMNKKVSVQSHPQGKNFCLDLMARKFVTQGEDAISSSHVAAFPIASVIIGLWKAHPSFGEMFLTHVFTKCPHLIPYRMPQLEGQSDNDYNITLGYEVYDGNLESEEKFLKRTSGITRLFAAIMISSLPRGIPPPHPYGISHAWTWFAKTVNMDPIPRITASVLYDMLDVCGHSLMQTYGKQFQKLVMMLYREYFPKIQAVTPAGSQGPTSRLEMLLQTCIRQGRIPQPQGLLPSNFWST